MRAHGLPAADRGGYSDPYAKLTVSTGDKQLKKTSKTKNKTLDPEWFEVRALPQCAAAHAR